MSLSDGPVVCWGGPVFTLWRCEVSAELRNSESLVRGGEPLSTVPMSRWQSLQAAGEDCAATCTANLVVHVRAQTRWALLWGGVTPCELHHRRARRRLLWPLTASRLSQVTS